MQIPALDHGGIKTIKLEETRAVFVEVLGLSVGPRPAFDVTTAELAARGVHVECETTPGGEPRQFYRVDPNGVRIALNAPGESC